MKIYDSVLPALNDLKLRGFITDFNLAFDSIKCSETGQCLSPSQFEIVEHYRFEGDSNPSDMSIVYAISSKDGKMKGVLVSAYGMYSDPVNDDMILKLQVNE